MGKEHVTEMSTWNNLLNFEAYVMVILNLGPVSCRPVSNLLNKIV